MQLTAQATVLLGVPDQAQELGAAHGLSAGSPTMTPASALGQPWPLNHPDNKKPPRLGRRVRGLGDPNRNRDQAQPFWDMDST
jgi:hypothetical protein